MIHLLPLALAKAKWKIPGFEESSSDSIVAERIEIVTKLILRDGRGRLAILADSLVFLI
jgi:hypothetical protein